MPVIRVEELERFRLSVQVSEEDLSQVRRGSPVRVMLRDQTQVMGKGHDSVVPSLDPATRRAPVEIEVPNQTEGMVDGNGARLHFGYRPSQCIASPWNREVRLQPELSARWTVA